MTFNRADFYDAELRRHNEHLRTASLIGPRDRVLDIGCGAGQSTRDAARSAQFGSVLGVDGDPGEEAGIAVCVAALDISPNDFGRLPVVYSDGLHDRPELQPAVVSYL